MVPVGGARESLQMQGGDKKNLLLRTRDADKEKSLSSSCCQSREERSGQCLTDMINYNHADYIEQWYRYICIYIYICVCTSVYLYLFSIPPHAVLSCRVKASMLSGILSIFVEV